MACLEYTEMANWMRGVQWNGHLNALDAMEWTIQRMCGMQWNGHHGAITTSTVPPVN
jgi:hypothetical protein